MEEGGRFSAACERLEGQRGSSRLIREPGAMAALQL